MQGVGFEADAVGEIWGFLLNEEMQAPDEDLADCRCFNGGAWIQTLKTPSQESKP